MFTDFKAKIRILSTGTYLPDEIIKSDDLFAEFQSDIKYGIAEDWMSKEMGIIERRVAPEDATPSSLAISAAKQALDAASDINPDDIDLVIFCGIEGDQSEPATAHTIQCALGLKAPKVFDVSNACFGFVDGIETASAYISSGIARYALVVTGEVSCKISRYIVDQLKTGVPVEIAKSAIGGLSVGDAGGAVILGNSENSLTGFNFFKSSCDSRHVNKCIYKHKPDGHLDGQMLMAKVVAYGLRMHRQLMTQTIDETGVDKYDWLISHQTGQRNFDAIASMGIIDATRMTKTFDKLGNVTTATLPINFQMLLREGVEEGDLIGFWMAGSGLTVGQSCYTV